MSKINLQYSTISTNCVDKIDSAIKSINSALTYLQAFDIPGDFYRRTQLINTISKLKNQYQKLVTIKTSIVNSNSDYNTVIDDLIDAANNLPVDKIKKRASII